MCSLKNVCSLHSRTPSGRKPPDTRKELTFMASQSKSSNGSSAKAGATKVKTGAKQAKSGAKQVANAEKNQALVVAETAVDLPVGAVLSVTRSRRRAGRALHRPHHRRAKDQGLPQRAAPHPEADRAPRHQRPSQSDDRGEKDPHPGRARGAQAPAQSRDDAEAQPQRGRAARPQDDRRAGLARPGSGRAAQRAAPLDPLAAPFSIACAPGASSTTHRAFFCPRPQSPRTATGSEPPGS